MRFLIQRVTEASLKIDGEVYSSIGKGYMVLIGIADEDTKDLADKMVKKMVNLRIFEDENGKTNLALKDVGGEIMLVSQFTLYADTRRGNRPGFTRAGKPEFASDMYDYIVSKTREMGQIVKTGVFGADMKISLTNDGPFTILLDSDEWK